MQPTTEELADFQEHCISCFAEYAIPEQILFLTLKVKEGRVAILSTESEVTASYGVSKTVLMGSPGEELCVGKVRVSL